MDKYNDHYPTYNDPKFYNEMSGDAYDGMAKAANWCQPMQAASVIGEGKVVDIDPATSEVLDFASGTGANGVNLHEKGFKNFTAVDGSDALLEKLNSHGIYKSSR